MNREKQDELPKMQIGFIDSICAPIYTAFAKLFPKQLYTLIDGCLTNRNIWCQLAESNTKPDTTVTNYLACDTEGPRDKLLPNNSNMSKSETRLPSQMLEASGENLQMPATEDADDQADSNSSTKQNRFASTTKLPALSSIENKLAETGVSLVQVAKERHNGQRKSI
jgi:dual 3',5'-cyclic-AMP and -GMP phosphodiesterase 11